MQRQLERQADGFRTAEHHPGERCAEKSAGTNMREWLLRLISARFEAFPLPAA